MVLNEMADEDDKNAVFSFVMEHGSSCSTKIDCLLLLLVSVLFVFNLTNSVTLERRHKSYMFIKPKKMITARKRHQATCHLKYIPLWRVIPTFLSSEHRQFSKKRARPRETFVGCASSVTRYPVVTETLWPKKRCCYEKTGRASFSVLHIGCNTRRCVHMVQNVSLR